MSSKRFDDADHVNRYGKARKNTPNEAIEIILGYLSEKLDRNEWKLAVDVGCGSGQCANSLAPYFRTVCGFDVSASQVEFAINSDHPNNVLYGVSSAEDLSSIATNSVQLITASKAANWFDLRRFFNEADRVLTPNGVVSLFSYRNVFRPFDASNPSDHRLADLITEVNYDPLMQHNKTETILSDNREESRYRSIRFPDSYEYLYKDSVVCTVETTADKVIDHIRSYSRYYALLKNNTTLAENFISSIEQKFRDILAVRDLSQKQLYCNFDYYIAMGRKPQ